MYPEIEYFYPGQVVMLKNPDAASRGKVFRVTKVNPKRLKVEDEKGAGFQGPHAIWTKTDQPFVSRAPKTPPLCEGMLVRCEPLRSPKWRYPADQLFVVTKVSADRVSISRLGGEDPSVSYRGWTTGPRSLTVVDPADVLR